MQEIKRRPIQLIILSIFCGSLFTSCLLDGEPPSNKKLAKDFWLSWWGEKADQHILCSTSADGNSGSVVIKQTVFAVGCNDDFIIAKQHPDKQEEIADRLFNRDSSED